MKRAWMWLLVAALPLAVTVKADVATVPASRPAAQAADAKSRLADKKISLGQAAILGVVEGVTEYLPVSSTGHLILAGDRMGLVEVDPSEHGLIGPKLIKSPAIDAFDVVIQFGAILAVVGLYRKRVKQMGLGLMGKYPAGMQLVLKLMVAFMPAAIFGLIFNNRIKENLFGPVPVLIALAAGGVLMIVVEYFFWTRRKDRQHMSIDQMGFDHALVIGLAQVLAMWPGTSRSMITIIAGLIVGLDMVAAAEFSFLLALPTLTAATFYDGFKSRHELMQSAGVGAIIVGTVVSGVVAALAVKVFVKWLTKHGMMPFGVYRIVLAAVYGWMLLG